MKFLQVSGDKDAEIRELQSKVSELEPLRAQTKDWELKYTAMMQEREAETAKLRGRISELEPLAGQLNDWQTKYQSAVAEKDAAINSLQSQLSAATAGAATLTAIGGAATAESDTATAPRGDLLEIEGIGDHYLSKLNAVNLHWQAELLEQGASKKGRAEIAEKSGISESLILRWVNHIDLIRIHGIGPQFAELLEAAGVDSVPELAQRNAANLHAKLLEVNAARNLVGRDASLNEVTDWIEQAKTLPRVVTY
jgi:predicted flap endonuclease-1-like 5' DNA nuclease